MKTLEWNQLENLEGGALDCDTQLGLGFGLMVGGILLGVATFGVGAAIAVVGYGIGWQGATGQGCNR